MSLGTIQKDGTDDALYSFDMTALLGTSETISSQTVTEVGSSDLTIGTPTETDGVIEFRLSGGTEGTSYVLACEIVTSDSNTYERSGVLQVEAL